MRWAWMYCQPLSFVRYGADILYYRYIGRSSRAPSATRREITLKSGVNVVYRRCRADIQTVREVWFQQTYRLPFELPGSGGLLLDLGGNIGQASIYLAKRYHFDRILTVEPVKENADLAKLNFELNSVKADIVQAAVAPRSGEALFAPSDDLNRGRLAEGGSGGVVVRTVAIGDLVGPAESIRLIKMDIEGGEGPLLTESTSWLDRTEALVAEFHPTLVDYPALVELLCRRGFKFFAPGGVFRWSTDAFLRSAS